MGLLYYFMSGVVVGFILCLTMIIYNGKKNKGGDE